MSSGIVRSLAVMLALGLGLPQSARAQQAPPAQPAAEAPPVPRGIEVQARGPVHEAFASATTEPKATPVVAKQPPKALDEMPPEERPEGDVVWIAGYWAWDDDRNDYLWVSGCWRTKPPGKEWVAGYWRPEGSGWQWVPGFWHDAAANGQAKEVTYYPEPPEPPAVAPPGEPPAADTFYVPGYWVWNGNRYAWHAGYWSRVQPGYVWVPAHYRWTPYGYVYVAGYWDLAVRRRGILYAPVVVDYAVVGPTFVYTPAYAVSDVVVVDTLFIRPHCCCYYFGDYYGPRYVALGYESCVVYSRRHYDPIIVYACWEHRAEPRWIDVQARICFDRGCGRAPVPPRTLVQQTTIINKTVINNTVVNKTVINNVQVVAPASRLAAANGQRVVTVDPATRLAAKTQAQTIQRTTVEQRVRAETPAGVRPTAPRTAALTAPAARAVAPQGGLARTTNTTIQHNGPAGQSSVTRTQTTVTPAPRPTGSRPPGPYGSGLRPAMPPAYGPGARPGNLPLRDTLGRPIPPGTRPGALPLRPDPNRRPPADNDRRSPHDPPPR